MSENVKISDLRKGNLIQTEYGILPVFDISFNDVQVIAKDGRKLWAKQFEGIDLLNFNMPDIVLTQVKDLLFKDFKRITDVDSAIIYVSDLQNWYYWNSGKKELEITI